MHILNFKAAAAPAAYLQPSKLFSKLGRASVSIFLPILQGVNDLAFSRFGSTFLDFMCLKHHLESTSEVQRLLLIYFKCTKLLPGYIYKTNG